MTMQVGFLGLGQCGGNICEVAEQNGYRTAIMNTSPEDLESIAAIKNKMLVGDNGGCGKDRNIAKSEVRKYYRDIVDYVKTKFSDSEIKIVYLVFSCGGGTGSGMAPIILDVLSKSIPEKKFGAIAILPSLDESAVAQFNTLENLNELLKLDVPMLLVDNEKFVASQKLSKRQLFDTVNNALINDFNILLKKERKSSKYGNLDSKDMTKLLLTPGNTVIATLRIFSESYDAYGFAKKVMSSWDKSIYCDLEYDHVVKRMGFIYEVNDSITKNIDYAPIEKEIGKALEVFEGIYTAGEEEQTVVSVVTGLSFPEKRLRKIKEVLSRTKEGMAMSSKKNVNIMDDGINWFNDVRQEPAVKVDSDGDLDIDSLFSNY